MDEITFAKKLDLVIRDKKKTYASVARDAGLGTSTVRDIVKGRSKNPRRETLIKIARVLDVSVGEFDEEVGSNIIDLSRKPKDSFDDMLQRIALLERLLVQLTVDVACNRQSIIDIRQNLSSIKNKLDI